MASIGHVYRLGAFELPISHHRATSGVFLLGLWAPDVLFVRLVDALLLWAELIRYVDFARRPVTNLLLGYRVLPLGCCACVASAIGSSRLVRKLICTPSAE